MRSAYDDLVHRLHRLSGLGESAALLQWDMETYMPPGGAEARAMQLATLSALSHEMFTSPELGRALAIAEKEETDPKHRALLREVRFAYDRATKVSTDLVEKMSHATARALPIWTKARQASDFAAFRPVLEEIVDLKRQYAAAIDASAPAYEVLFRDYEPWVSLDETRRNLARLRDGLKPLIQKAARQPRPRDVFQGKWPQADQAAFSVAVLRELGYDFERGRLDISAHPFSTGNVFDSRITTRYDEQSPLGALLGTIHEFGHSLYTQGLPREGHGTPLGEARDMAVHESQSRLWENHVGRSRAFWERWIGPMQKAFPHNLKGATAEDAWRAVNVVEPSFIRTEADELTYHMHVTLRFEIEEAVIAGKAQVRDVPAMWNERMQSYLGVTPPDDRQGCLQDIHWSHGSFGYFPTYSLGSILSAQLFAAFERERGPAAPSIRAGEHAPLRAWLREKVHRHGKRYETGELVERATGKALAPDDFLAYARTKYGELWSAP
ncbi:MAG: carboxypeptidase Taq [Thermoplasmata archaeon]|jgi:carboxypeptidase Taq|nr:carboxypeptidase Taq [Thermoplasmata archaeon]